MATKTTATKRAKKSNGTKNGTKNGKTSATKGRKLTRAEKMAHLRRANELLYEAWGMINERQKVGK